MWQVNLLSCARIHDDMNARVKLLAQISPQVLRA